MGQEIGHVLNVYDQANRTLKVLSQSEKGINALLAANGITQAATGRDLFGKQLTKDEQRNSLLQGMFMMNLFTRKLAISPEQKAIVHEQGQAFKEHVSKVLHRASESVGSSKWKPAMAGVPDDFAKISDDAADIAKTHSMAKVDEVGKTGDKNIIEGNKGKGEVIGKVSRTNVEIRSQVLKNLENSKKIREASRYQLSGPTDQYVKLSNKNLKRILEYRGLDSKTVGCFADSFDGGVYAKWGNEGESMVITESKLGDASGIFVTRESAGLTPAERINKLALPPNNTAVVERNVQLANDQLLLEGKVAAQPEWALIADDGIERDGGAWQVVTNGGRWNNAIK
ncbi:MAG: hypothetical protein K0S80_4198 [Neobacillus sp.]|nr:hypothetical protein [Neobacillus sp.]